MANLHVLTGNAASGQYRVIGHVATPAGNNSAGVSWATAIKNGIVPVTSLAIGSGSGAITTAEANNVANGTIIEFEFTWQDHDEWDIATKQADLNAKWTAAKDVRLAELQNQLKLFGYTAG